MGVERMGRQDWEKKKREIIFTSIGHMSFSFFSFKNIYQIYIEHLLCTSTVLGAEV
jgi:hypothetical protein